MSAPHRPPTRDRHTVDLDPRRARLLCAVTFHGRPATGNVKPSVPRAAWIEQVREQAAAIKTKVPPGARLWARVDAVLRRAR